MTTTAAPEIIAVSAEEYENWGCPHCGYRSGSSSIQCDGTSVVICGGCTRTNVLLHSGRERSAAGFGNHPPVYPALQAHPRRGIPKHGNADTRPDDHGGEHFHPRGIGQDWIDCFICGSDSHEPRRNLAAFVQCKAAGERIVAMFEKGARLDYRDYEPDRVQVKVGACDVHDQNLRRLHELTSGDSVINTDRIAAAQS